MPTLNQSVMTLNTSALGILVYEQRIDMSNPFYDSAYNNHITFFQDFTQIDIPEQIDAIDNIECTNGEVFLYDTKSKTVISITSSSLITKNKLIRQKPICLRIRWDNKTTIAERKISFNVYLFKAYIREIFHNSKL
jgi:hypothetical protein